MFMPHIYFNWGIFDCFSSGIYLGWHLTNANRCLCLSLKSTKAISLLRILKKLCHCSSFSREATTIFLSSIFEHHCCRTQRFFLPHSCSFVSPPSVRHRAGLLRHACLLHYCRRRGCKAASIVVVQSHL